MRCPLLATVALSVAGLAVPAVALGPSDNHVAEFAQDIAARLDTLESALHDLDAQFADDIGAASDALDAGTATAPETHLAVFALVDELDAGVAEALRDFTDGVEADASLHLQDMALFPNAFAVGDGGLIDKAAKKAVKLRVKSTVKNFAKVHKLAKKLKQDHGYDLIFDRRGQIVEPVTPSDVAGQQAADPALPLRIDLLMSGSEKGLDALSDGTIALTGTADPLVDDVVTVSIAIPGGDTTTAMAADDPVSGRWAITFPESLPGALPEGTYAVTVTQAGVSISDSIAVQ
jgi:hypothetical protein